jgi:hypothetical protein
MTKKALLAAAEAAEGWPVGVDGVNNWFLVDGKPEATSENRELACDLVRRGIAYG